MSIRNSLTDLQKLKIVMPNKQTYRIAKILKTTESCGRVNLEPEIQGLHLKQANIKYVNKSINLLINK